MLALKPQVGESNLCFTRSGYRKTGKSVRGGVEPANPRARHDIRARRRNPHPQQPQLALPRPTPLALAANGSAPRKQRRTL